MELNPSSYTGNPPASQSISIFPPTQQAPATRPDPYQYPYDTAIVNQLLKQKRKKRGITTCYPCRQRKVRCDGQSTRGPCSNCVRRDHPELCKMPAPATRSLKDTSGVAEIVSGSLNPAPGAAVGSTREWDGGFASVNSGRDGGEGAGLGIGITAFVDILSSSFCIQMGKLVDRIWWLTAAETIVSTTDRSPHPPRHLVSLKIVCLVRHTCPLQRVSKA